MRNWIWVVVVLAVVTALGAQNVRVLDAVSGTKSWRETSEQIGKRPAKSSLSIDMSSWRWVRGERHYVGSGDRPE